MKTIQVTQKFSKSGHHLYYRFLPMYADLFFNVMTCLYHLVGDIISRLSSDTTQVSVLISQNVNVFLRSTIKGTGHFIFMCGLSWKLTMVTIMGLPFIALASKHYGEYYKVRQFSPCAKHLIHRCNVEHILVLFSIEIIQRSADKHCRGQ